jgi:hypothetical protein
MSRDLALAFTFSCIRAPDLSPRDRLRLGQTFGGVDEGGAVAAQGLNGEGPHVGGHAAKGGGVGGHEALLKLARLAASGASMGHAFSFTAIAPPKIEGGVVRPGKRGRAR